MQSFKCMIYMLFCIIVKEMKQIFHPVTKYLSLFYLCKSTLEWTKLHPKIQLCEENELRGNFQSRSSAAFLVFYECIV